MKSYNKVFICSSSQGITSHDSWINQSWQIYYLMVETFKSIEIWPCFWAYIEGFLTELSRVVCFSQLNFMIYLNLFTVEG